MGPRRRREALPALHRALRARHPGSDRESFVNQVLLIQEWRHFPFLDPDLPAELLQQDWPGPRAAAVFHDLRNRWHRRAQAEWDAMQDGTATSG
ncbi:PaaX family transcriptional regulator C-terminal domain-containing protein [Nonomuraea rubra]|uniref:PaaX family transcriptional regulator C-terminal domain-containing protein n=1 Tax=Nonomuraea rubra TaxID=46180 RepID=UPI00360855E1